MNCPVCNGETHVVDSGHKKMVFNAEENAWNAKKDLKQWKLILKCTKNFCMHQQKQK